MASAYFPGSGDIIHLNVGGQRWTNLIEIFMWFRNIFVQSSSVIGVTFALLQSSASPTFLLPSLVLFQFLLYFHRTDIPSLQISQVLLDISFFVIIILLDSSLPLERVYDCRKLLF
ncbi:unnamed protein product, partial [Meganyctiphanes norvegica]